MFKFARFLPLLAHSFLASLLAFACVDATSCAQTATEGSSTPPPKQAIQPVTTTVVVQGHVSDDYLPTATDVGSLDGLPLLQTPVSATVVTRGLMTDQFSRVLSDLVKNDASIGEDYAPVGYYGDFQIRGFSVDLATGLQINGMPIAGEQDVPLENKERVEFLKGIAGVESGITSAGGLINYVTKRPAPIKAIDLATDHRGSSYTAVDLGQVLGAGKQFGLRENMAGEDIHTYVESANGWRGVGALAADWKLSDHAAFKTDFEYQHKRERSVAGYQLLGGTTVPSLSRVFPSNMLGNQPWSKPNIFDAINSGARLDLNVSSTWKAFVEGSYSHSLIDDNVIYPYGCYYEAECNVPGGAQPFFFAPDGTYDIYDYRDPGERRVDAIGEAIALGRLKLGGLTHNLVVGGSLFHRGVELPGLAAPGAPATVQNGAVYTYIGSENIYTPNMYFDPESPRQQAGPLSLADFDRQASGIVQDRLDLPRRVRLTAGARYASVSDFNFAGKKGLWLPQYSATWAPAGDVTLYGNYSVLLSLGPQAPFWAINGVTSNINGVFLAPFLTRQAEIGVKFEPGQRILLTADVFRMRAPFFYPRYIAAPDAICPVAADDPGFCFEADGRETHDGLELGAQGKAASWLRISATAAAIEAVSGDSGTLAFNDRQVINVPRYKTALFADIALPRRAGLRLPDVHLLQGWSYTSSKEATRDDAVKVGGYNLFNLGARYSPGGDEGHLTFRMYADNLLDKRYWKDTGASYGDTFIHLGAPATVRLSGQYRF